MRASELRQRWLDVGRHADAPRELWKHFLELATHGATGCDPDRDGDLLLFEAGLARASSSYVASVQRQLFEETGDGDYTGMTTFGFTVPLAEPADEKQWGSPVAPGEFRDAVEASAAFRAIREDADATIW